MTSSQTPEELPWFGPGLVRVEAQEERFDWPQRSPLPIRPYGYYEEGENSLSSPSASTNSTPDILWMSRGEYNILLFYHRYY